MAGLRRFQSPRHRLPTTGLQRLHGPLPFLNCPWAATATRSRRSGARSTIAGRSSTAIAVTIRPTIDSLASAAALADTDHRRTFVMLPRREGRQSPAGMTLKLVSGSASSGRFVLQDVTDGNPVTHWSTGTSQRGDEEVLLQLDGLHRVSGIILSMGSFAESYPVRLRIETSRDGTTWTTATEEATAGLAFSAILENALRAQLSFRLPDVESRFVRLRQFGRDPVAHWIIGDVTILGQ